MNRSRIGGTRAYAPQEDEITITMIVQTLTAATILAAGSAMAGQADGFYLSDAKELSVAPVGGYDGQSAAKGKIISMEFPDGAGGFTEVLLSVYADAQGPDAWTPDATMFGAHDIFSTYALD